MKDFITESIGQIRKLRHKRTYPGPLEQKFINFLLQYTPGWVSSDMMTMFGLLGSFVTAAGYILSSTSKDCLFLGIVGYAMNWYGDSLDGQLARYRNRPRPNYGFYIDKLIDAISILVICAGMGLSSYVDFGLAMVFASMYLLLSIHVHMLTYVEGVANAEFLGLGPTEIRILGSVFVLVNYFYGDAGYCVFGREYTLSNIIIAGFSAGLIIVFLVSMITKAYTLRVLDENELAKKDSEKNPKNNSEI